MPFTHINTNKHSHTHTHAHTHTHTHAQAHRNSWVLVVYNNDTLYLIGFMPFLYLKYKPMLSLERKF